MDADNGVARVITRNSSKKVGNVQAAVPCKARVAVCQVDGGPWVTLEGTAEVRTEAVAVADAVTALRKAVRANARHGVNVQVVTDPDGRLLWLSPALPGRAHDLTAARTHGIIRICERQGVPILADLAYQGGGPWVTTGIKRRPLQELTLTEKTVNRALAAARAPVERGVARLKSWRIFRRSRCSPNRMTSIAKAILTLERQR